MRKDCQDIKQFDNMKSSSLLVVKTQEDFANIGKVSPYSNKSESQRISDLFLSVREAKAALETYSQPRPISILTRFRRAFFKISY